MLFDTLAEYDAAIAEAKPLLIKAIKEQAITAGGPAQGQHTARGAVRDIKEYLELLSKEKQILVNRQASGGGVNLVRFPRPS